MSGETVTPKSFYSDSPPERIIGTECEVNIQNHSRLTDEIKLPYYINGYALGQAGIRFNNGYLDNGARLYTDCGHLEYATAECLGPKQAAAAEIGGIDVLKAIVSASKYPHSGMFRTTATFIDKGPGENAGFGPTSGYHENFLISRRESRSRVLTSLVPSHLASRLWAGSGTLRDAFVFSQKVWGIGDEPVDREYGRRTKNGKKPMVLLPGLKYDSDVLPDNDWARLEVRFADAGLSPDARFLSLAATSLVIRVAEHSKRLNQKKIHGLELVDPVGAARRFSEDLSLIETAQTTNGKAITAMNIQEALVELALDLAEEIELPEDENQALAIWADVIDAMKKSNPENAEYGSLAEMLDFAAKHSYLLKRLGKSGLHFLNDDGVQRNLLWDRIDPQGGGQIWWEHHPPKHVDPLDIEFFAANPPPTRAKVRADVIARYQEHISILNWGAYTVRGRQQVILSNPYETE